MNNRPTQGRFVNFTIDKITAEQISKLNQQVQTGTGLSGSGGGGIGGGGHTQQQTRHYAPGEQVPFLVTGTNGTTCNGYLFPDGGGGPLYVSGIQYSANNSPRTWNWMEGTEKEAAA
ncbi:MAG: hypothetical protein JO033_04800 [Acidobacteriaceae bacterium]|nr:hypothetical protein [Acidobacteriaceae bacterium]MBV9179860.1 hypothetical protein [Acidobacteriota bacterium]